MSDFHNKAVILGVRPLGEADLLVTFLDEDRGKIKGVARNAKRSKGRFGGTLQIGTELLVKYEERPRSELVNILEVSGLKLSGLSGSHLDRFYAMSIALEIVDRLSPPNQTVAQRYNLLTSFMENMAALDRVWTLLMAFAWKWIAMSGYRPLLSSCVACGDPVDTARRRFVADAGGVVCDGCYSGPFGSVPVTCETLELIDKMVDSRFSELGSCLPTANIRYEAEMVLDLELKHLLGRPLNSYKYILHLE